MMGFLILFSARQSPAQQLAWDHWTVEDGLSNNEVTDIHQDQFGWIWLATGHGLTSYNGYEFEVYRYHPFDSNSIGANYVEALYETDRGDIWASLSVGGLSELDRASMTFHSYQSEWLADANLRATNTFARALLQDDQGEVWVGTRAGLNRIVRANYTYERVWPSQADERVSINCLYQTEGGHLLLGTDQGMYIYDVENETAQRPKIVWRDTSWANNYPINHILQDSNGKLWFGSEGGGVFLWETGSKVLIPQWEKVDPKVSGPQHCVSLMELQGEIWASFQRFGLKRMDSTATVEDVGPLATSIRWALAMNGNVCWGLSEDGYVVQVNKRTGEIGTEKTSSMDFDWRTVCLADDGALWFASSAGGVGRTYHHMPKVKDLQLINGGQEPQNVRAMLTDTEGGFWIANHEGLLRQLSDQPRAQHWHFSSEQIPGNVIYGMAEDQNQQVWVATNNGLACLSWKHSKIKRYRADPDNPHALRTNFVRGVSSDKQGRIWVGTSMGLHLYHPTTDDFQRFLAQDHPNSLNGNDVRIVLEADSNVYWVGKVRTGLDRMTYFPDQDSISCEAFYFRGEHHFSDSLMTINSLTLDQAGQLWIGTFSDGLLHFDDRQQALVSVFEDQAPIPGITAIQEGRDGSLWMGSNTGLYRYDPNAGLLQQFLGNDGVQSPQFHIGSYALGPNGRLYFGSTKGVNFVEPAINYQPGLLSTPQIVGIQKYGQTMRFPQAVQQLEQLNLSSRDAFFSIHYLAINFQMDQPLKYRYRLEGLQEDWIEIGEQRSVSFSHLPGGAYVFRVSVGDRQGNWSEKEAILPIVVAFPFHQRPIFYFLMASFILLLAWGIHSLRWYFQRRKLLAMATVRERAVADFHDELGHRLTKISLFIERVFHQNPRLEGESHQYLQKISSNASELYHSMRDFLWTMNPKKDALLELAILLKDFGDELYSQTPIAFEVEGLESLPAEVTLSMDWKRQLVLIFKEGMHNSLKHAQCTHVQLSFKWEGGALQVDLEDNGKGFVHSPQHMGYGLNNMQDRAERIDGQLIISSQPYAGTKISFKGWIQMQQLWLKKKAFR